MNNQFDELAKSMAQSVARRGALKKFRFGPPFLTRTLQPFALTTGLLLAALAAGLGQNAASQPLVPPFSAVYGFGFSWTDTRHCNANPQLYYRKRASNGPLWIDYFSAQLGLPYDEKKNFAHCGATSAEVLDQVEKFKPQASPESALYCLWAGDSEFLFHVFVEDPTFIDLTDEPAWRGVIATALNNNSNALIRLYEKGARSVVVQNLFDLGKTPDFISRYGEGSASQLSFREYISTFNDALRAMLRNVTRDRRDLRIFLVDTQARLDDLIANAVALGFTRTTIDALSDPTLIDKSFGGPGASYVFWDPAHATTKVHVFIADWVFEALTRSAVE